MYEGVTLFMGVGAAGGWVARQGRVRVVGGTSGTDRAERRIVR